MKEEHKIKKNPAKLTINISDLLKLKKKKIKKFSESGGRIMRMFSVLITKGRYSERSAQD